MLHIKDNIKILRRVWRMNQGRFAALFTDVNLNKQKYLETKASLPDILYIQELSRMTGISEKDLMNKRISLDQIPDQPIISDEKVEKVSRGTLPQVYDSKDAILRMLDKALDENARHAAANEKHADNVAKLIDMLGIKLSSNENEKASELSADANEVELNPVQQTDVFVDKKVVGSGRKKTEKQKGISS